MIAELAAMAQRVYSEIGKTLRFYLLTRMIMELGKGSNRP